MGLISRLSLRNLLRQKRRNLFLGIGIAFGMMILVIANSFSHGIADVLINDLVAYGYGHLVLAGTPGNSSFWIFRDGPYIKNTVTETIKKDDLVRMIENIAVLVRAVGHGEADNIYITGYTPQNVKDKKDFFYNPNLSIIEGDINDYFSKEIEYPIIIFAEKAKSLNIKVHEKFQVSVPMVTGQVQTAQFTVVALAKSNIPLMDMTSFMEVDRVKKLLGYKPWESASLQITLKNPKQNAKYYGDILRKKLTPGILSIAGKVGSDDCRILAFKNDDESKNLITKNIRIVNGDLQKSLGKEGVMVPGRLARKLGLHPGGEFTYLYQTKYLGIHQEKFEITAVYESQALGENMILMNGEKIFDIYNKFLPEMSEVKAITPEFPVYSALATEWKMFSESKDNTELQKKYIQDRKIKTHQAKFNVVTMYVGASDILSLESVLNLVTFIAVLVLFFIILIGVVNTLRMTIKERTREIGTVRAIGMQKKDVRNMFILETLFLTAVSCVAGIILGIIIMQFLGLIRFDPNNALNMILKNRRLVFKLDMAGILFNFILIMIIAGVTAYFPARRAAKLSAVAALRHYE